MRMELLRAGHFPTLKTGLIALLLSSVCLTDNYLLQCPNRLDFQRRIICILFIAINFRKRPTCRDIRHRWDSVLGEWGLSADVTCGACVCRSYREGNLAPYAFDRRLANRKVQRRRHRY